MPSQSFAQSTLPQDWGAHFKAKIGDKMNFEITKANFYGNYYFPNTIFLENGSTITVNMSVGTLMTVKIIDFNESPSYVQYPNGSYSYVPGLTAYTQIMYELKSPISNFYTNYTGQVMANAGFIIPAFDNKSMVNAYINSLNQISNVSKATFSFDDNYIYQNQILNVGQIILHLNSVFSWKVGWLQSAVLSGKNNSANLFEYDIENLSYLNTSSSSNNDQLHTLLPTVTNYIAYAFLLGTPIVIGALFVYSWINYKKGLATLTNGSKKSFFKYLKQKIKKSRVKQQTNQPRDIDKSLNIIKEIINESNQNK